ncbi:hypothetical protein F5Y12DRAFT_639546 [Xylaria sp. FL1777]|nr:hypothetical protein F5Y12DRAFT_639546 [Xylaria sp. FL1777]
MDSHSPDPPKDIEMSGIKPTVENPGPTSINQSILELQSILNAGFGSVHSRLEAWIQDEVEKRFPQNRSNLKEQEYTSSSLLPLRGGNMRSDPNHDLDQEILRRQMRDLAAHLSTLNMRLDGISPESKRPGWKEAVLQKQLSEQKEEIHKLTEKVRSLRNALIVTKPQVIDSDVSQQFVMIRSSITNMVRSTFENEFEEPFPDPLIEDKNFFSPFRTKKRHMKFLLNRVRGKIFEIIHVKILSRLFYPGGCGKELETVERVFLENMPRADLNLKDFVEWRSASIKCTQALHKRRDAGFNSEDSKDYELELPEFVSETAHSIWDFFSPLKIKEGKNRKRGFELLLRACQEAYRLTELMRRARDVFYVEIGDRAQPEDIPTLVDEEFSETLDSYSRDGIDGSIAYWTFGALTKRIEEDPKALRVMVKGLVVVYKSS